MPCRPDRRGHPRNGPPPRTKPTIGEAIVGRSWRHRAGFSLIEILVVVVVIGVVVTAATLAYTGADRELEQAARRVETRVRLACERALATGTDIGFALVENRLRFGRLIAGRWEPVAADSGEVLRERPTGEDVTVVAFRDGLPLPAVEPLQPQFACFGSGELTPFRLVLRHPGATRVWHVDGHVDGRIEVADERPR